MRYIVSVFLMAILSLFPLAPLSGVFAQPLVNLPYFGATSRMNEAAIFWFGQVDSTSNYADIRLGYTDTELKVYLHIMDRYLWYDPTPDISTLTDYDAVSLYLSTSDQLNTSISPTEYLFIGQLNWWENELNFQTVYQGTSIGSWDIIAAPLVHESNWRGNAPNDLVDDRGWTMFFNIPFTQFDLDQSLSKGTHWRLAVVLHDKDGNTSGPESVQTWPVNADPADPATWADVNFGIPGPTQLPNQDPITYTIRQDTTQSVTDAHIGGHGDCGGDSTPEFFPTWGSRNYAGYTQITEQNQWDIADWPCFSKMLFRFPLNSLPANKTVTSATLTLHQFGNSDPSQAQPSYIQVLTAPPTWDEATVTWNNAPPPQENIAAAWVDPVSGTIVWPGWRRDWDVSYGLAKAYQQGQSEFSLILYSADGEYHSGKYFTSSDIGDWDLIGRPTLTISLAEPITNLTGDLDNDNDVDLLDLLKLLGVFSTSSPVFGDLNNNGRIDIFDVNILIKNL